MTEGVGGSLVPLRAESHRPLRRCVALRARCRRVDAEIRDAVHAFAVSIMHHDGRVTGISADAERTPWTTCPGAISRLQDLVGSPLESATPCHIDKSLQCTHLFDLARLAMAQAVRGGSRAYIVDVALVDECTVNLAPTIAASVKRDGVEVIRWLVRDRKVVSDGAFLGHRTTGPAIWPPGIENLDHREAVLLLRRALLVFVGTGQIRDVKAARVLDRMAGTCHSFQPGPMALAERPSNFRIHAADEVGFSAID